MANVRLTWTNNSTGHDGQRVRMDEPSSAGPDTVIADIGPNVEEYIALNATEPEACFTVAAYDGVGEEESAVACVETVGSTDWGSVSVGDYVEGGVYAGDIIYSDGREFHLIFGKQDSEASGLRWGNDNVTTGADDPDDGQANQDLILASFDNGDSEVFYHCRDYENDGHADWYPPARNELAKVDQLVNMAHAEFSTSLTSFRWASTELSTNNGFAWGLRFSDDNEGNLAKDGTNFLTRPIRRVPV